MSAYKYVVGVARPHAAPDVLAKVRDAVAQLLQSRARYRVEPLPYRTYPMGKKLLGRPVAARVWEYHLDDVPCVVVYVVYDAPYRIAYRVNRTPNCVAYVLYGTPCSMANSLDACPYRVGCGGDGVPYAARELSYGIHYGILGVAPEFLGGAPRAGKHGVHRSQGIRSDFQYLVECVLHRGWKRIGHVVRILSEYEPVQRESEAARPLYDRIRYAYGPLLLGARYPPVLGRVGVRGRVRRKRLRLPAEQESLQVLGYRGQGGRRRLVVVPDHVGRRPLVQLFFPRPLIGYLMERRQPPLVQRPKPLDRVWKPRPSRRCRRRVRRVRRPHGPRRPVPRRKHGRHLVPVPALQQMQLLPIAARRALSGLHVEYAHINHSSPISSHPMRSRSVIWVTNPAGPPMADTVWLTRRTAMRLVLRQ